MEDKKKRGCNYTETEKSTLLALVRKYQDIIENKRTSSKTITKKREAWAAICQQYNAVAFSGVRTWQQLRHLYENLKQRSKKITAIANKETDHYISCGLYKNKVEQDGQILIMVDPLSVPLSTLYHDGDYCCDEANSTENKEMHSSSKDTSNDGDENESTQKTNEHLASSTSNINGHTSSIPEDNIRQQYYKAKLRNAKLEYKNLINKNKMEINKYKLEMEILRIKLNRVSRTK